MRKLIALLLVFGLAVFSGNFVYAQDAEGESQTSTEQEQAAAEEEAAPAEQPAPAPAPAAEEAADEP
ncbi:MAG: hypothetical protein KDD01_20380, partial [Phaeodactylibacter sp.]|nr:hypothetical protein [Phaeodactylibacter sp.]